MARRSLTCAAAGSSPTSSSSSVPPEASTNLPTWRSVAPVNDPFSWPNRINSIRFSGMAPQFTATNGLLRRSPEPWMARAINSLPTPDSPAIRTGMVEAAAFSAMRRAASMAGLLVMMSLKPSVPDRLCLMRLSSPSSALVLSALRRLTCMRSAPAGLTTKSTAPARMAETTLSMPPWAVCTITGTLIRLGAIWPARRGRRDLA